MQLEEYLRGSVDIGIHHHSVSVEIDSVTKDVTFCIKSNVRNTDLLKFGVTGNAVVMEDAFSREVVIPVGVR